MNFSEKLDIGDFLYYYYSSLKGYKVVLKLSSYLRNSKNSVIKLSSPSTLLGKPVVSMEGCFLALAQRNSDSPFTLDLSDFDMTNIEDMYMAFSGLVNLTGIIWGKLPKRKIKNLAETFSNCLKLESVDMSGFNLSGVKELEFTFFQCRCLRHVDLGNLDWCNLKTAKGAFGKCIELRELSITCGKGKEKIESLMQAFNGTKLKEIDLGKLRSRTDVDMLYIVGGCTDLKRLILPNNCEVTGDALKYLVHGVFLFEKTEYVESLEHRECMDLSGFDLKEKEIFEKNIVGIVEMRVLGDIDKLLPKYVIVKKGMIHNLSSVCTVKNKEEAYKVVNRLIKLGGKEHGADSAIEIDESI